MNEFLFAVNTRWSIDDAFNIYIYAALPTATGLHGGDGGQLPLLKKIIDGSTIHKCVKKE